MSFRTPKGMKMISAVRRGRGDSGAVEAECLFDPERSW
jgi:hypothetical protein